jgi:phosphoribosyl 1,2-cyclic phosphodiesterase
LADAGERVLLVTTDPASNLADVFQQAIGPEPRAINGVPGLMAQEIDAEAAAAAYRQEALAPLRGVLPDAMLATVEEQMSGPCTVEVAGFEGEVVLSEVVGGDDFAIGQAKVRARWVPHVGRTLGYRVEQMGCSVAFVSDHQRPEGGVEVDAGVLELCEGADLVVHDAQYSAEEFDSKAAWGHSTVEYAVHVASEAGAKRLALFHHDPGHSDDDVDRLLEQASRLPEAASLAGIFAAYEGLAVDLGSP